MQPARPSLPREVARTVGGWITGQLKISGIVALLYMTGFALAGLPWWPLVGLVCGALQLIPFAGPAVAMLLALAVAWFGAASQTQAVIGAVLTFVITQALEGFYLTPKILGRRLRLPPFVVFLAVLAGGLFFGPIGVVFAAPVLAVAMVLWRHAGRRP